MNAGVDTLSKERFVNELRLGDRTSDNSNFVGAPGEGGDFMKDAELLSPRTAPLDDDVVALRRQLWLATDAAYKGAVETLERKRAAKQSEIAARREVPSFSDDTSARTIVVRGGKPRSIERAGALGRFPGYPEVQKSSVHLLETSKEAFVASDGAFGRAIPFFRNRDHLRRASGRRNVARAERSSPRTRSHCPATARFRGEAHRRRADRAPRPRRDYSGPVLSKARPLSSRTSARRIAVRHAAAQGNDDMDGRSHASSVSGSCRGLSVIDDPTLTTYEGSPLLGTTRSTTRDRCRAVVLVEDGHLKSFLMSRAPRDGISRSNGHGRSGLVGWARGHVGNLIVSAKKGLTKKELRARLSAEVRDEALDFGIVVTELQTRTSATGGEMMPSAQVAYRVTADGRDAERDAFALRCAIREIKDAGQGGSVYSSTEMTRDRHARVDRRRPCCSRTSRSAPFHTEQATTRGDRDRRSIRCSISIAPTLTVSSDRPTPWRRNFRRVQTGARVAAACRTRIYFESSAALGVAVTNRRSWSADDGFAWEPLIFGLLAARVRQRVRRVILIRRRRHRSAGGTVTCPAAERAAEIGGGGLSPRRRVGSGRLGRIIATRPAARSGRVMATRAVAVGHGRRRRRRMVGALPSADAGGAQPVALAAQVRLPKAGRTATKTDSRCCRGVTDDVYDLLPQHHGRELPGAGDRVGQRHDGHRLVGALFNNNAAPACGSPDNPSVASPFLNAGIDYMLEQNKDTASPFTAAEWPCGHVGPFSRRDRSDDGEQSRRGAGRGAGGGGGFRRK